MFSMFYNFYIIIVPFSHINIHILILYVTKMFDTASRAGICKQIQELC